MRHAGWIAICLVGLSGTALADAPADLAAMRGSWECSGKLGGKTVRGTLEVSTGVENGFLKETLGFGGSPAGLESFTATDGVVLHRVVLRGDGSVADGTGTAGKTKVDFDLELKTGKAKKQRDHLDWSKAGAPRVWSEEQNGSAWTTTYDLTCKKDDPLGKLDEFSVAMCQCKDKACADKVNASMQKFADEYSKGPNKDRKPTEAEMKRATDVMMRYSNCMSKAMGGP